MGINPGDIISTLQVLGMIKYWKGQHVILKKEDLIDEYLAKSRSRPKHRQVKYNVKNVKICAVRLVMIYINRLMPNDILYRYIPEG